jgi:hypothetical protein
MPTQYGDETVDELAELPSKQTYIANLRSVSPLVDEPTCAICRGPWEYPTQDVVQPSPHCSRHPLHKDCLLLTFATENGEEVSNLCPFCRCELFEKIQRQRPEPQANDEEDHNTFQQTIQHFDNLWAMSVQVEYNNDNVEHPELLYPSGPKIQDALQKDGFWVALPRFLDEWYVRNVNKIIERTQYHYKAVSPPNPRITLVGCAAITALFAHENNITELSKRATKLLDHQYGEVAMQCIGGAIIAYNMSAFPRYAGFLQRETRWLIAYHVLTSLLTAYRQFDKGWCGGMNMLRWLQLIRFRKMLHRELVQWAPSIFFAKLLPLKLIIEYGSLVGVTAESDEHDTLEIHYLAPHDDGTMSTEDVGRHCLYTGPVDAEHKLLMAGNSACPLTPNIKNSTLFHFRDKGSVLIRELNHCFIHDFFYNVEEGSFNIVNDKGGVLSITRRATQ